MDWKEFLDEFIFKFIKAGFYIYVPAQAIVYVSGRMLGVLNSYLTRNFLALISIISLSYFYIYMNIETETIAETIYQCIQWSSIGILFYTIIGMKLADRADHWLDAHFANDEETKKKRKKK